VWGQNKFTEKFDVQQHISKENIRSIEKTLKNRFKLNKCFFRLLKTIYFTIKSESYSNIALRTIILINVFTTKKPLIPILN
jgi:hypothetical protein